MSCMDGHDRLMSYIDGHGWLMSGIVGHGGLILYVDGLMSCMNDHGGLISHMDGHGKLILGSTCWAGYTLCLVLLSISIPEELLGWYDFPCEYSSLRSRAIAMLHFV